MTKLLLVLGAVLARGTGPVSLQELARELGLPQSSVHRILQLCVAQGMVSQTQDQRYVVGPAVLALGVSSAQDLGMTDAVRDCLAQLATDVGEEAYLTMRVGHEGIFVTRSASPRPLRVVEKLFESLPLHCGASRRVLLAYSDPGLVQEYLQSGPLQRFTENTLTDPDQLLLELERLRSDGVAFSFGERSPGVAGVAAPVLDAGGHALASVSVLAPEETLRGESRDEYARHVIACADEITRRLRLPAAGESKSTTGAQNRVQV